MIPSKSSNNLSTKSKIFSRVLANGSYNVSKPRKSHESKTKVTLAICTRNFTIRRNTHSCKTGNQNYQIRQIVSSSPKFNKSKTNKCGLAPSSTKSNNSKQINGLVRQSTSNDHKLRLVTLLSNKSNLETPKLNTKFQNCRP